MLTPGVLGPVLCVCVRVCVMLLPLSLCVGESLTILLRAGIDVCVYLSVQYNRLNDPVTYSMQCQDKKHKPVSALYY